ncbi:hypothetical protein [Aeromonas cavernicola]|uniref:Uncharacterized protein n=1 Tax=Aeromonas cavernicola TaxID=1006623 RepID=A0A2H9U089_9GAMM|nr:hypothetical protein [Aeromonas cavernicola]PJG57431.1 hypothetical protein CUC53_18070 [Aeromonas cavernicola]
MRAAWLSILLGNLIWSAQGIALETLAPAHTPLHHQQKNQPRHEVWRSTLDTNDLLKAPKPLSFGIEVTTDNYGNQRVTSYQQLNLTPEKGVSLSFERYKPRVKFKAGGMQTAIKLRGDGVKVQLSPVDKTIPLQVELKVTDDESSLRLDYRF